MNCKRCGGQINTQDKFCSHCGYINIDLSKKSDKTSIKTNLIIFLGFFIIVLVIIGIIFIDYHRNQNKVYNIQDSVYRYNNLLPMYGAKSYEEYIQNRGSYLEKIDNEFIKSVTNNGVLSNKNAGQGIVNTAFELIHLDNDTAMKRLNQIWLLDNNNPNIYIGFGFILFPRGEYERSIEYLEKALELYSNEYMDDYTLLHTRSVLADVYIKHSKTNIKHISENELNNIYNRVVSLLTENLKPEYNGTLSKKDLEYDFYDILIAFINLRRLDDAKFIIKQNPEIKNYTWFKNLESKINLK